MKKIRHTLAAFMLGCISAFAGEEPKTNSTFSIVSLNVDGLPGKLAFIPVNSDGPMSAGSERISEYLANLNCDILCLQEDFNYRMEIWSRLFANYQHDEWSGGIIYEDREIDFAHLQNLKFECDGLNTVWRNNIQSDSYERVPWQKSFGKFSHDFDDIITKGFRCHELTLSDGNQIVVYNMHMDASSNRDEKKGNDGKDREARISQWQQLRDHILEHLDQRPVIVVGDMNSYYHRDDFKTEFIDAITTTGRATVSDAWIEKYNKGIYPEMGSEPLEKETLDKALYINPTDGNSVELVNVSIDLSNYLYNDKPLGDHYPLIATFRYISSYEQGATRINQTAADANGATPEAYDLSGRPVDATHKGIAITKQGKFLKK
ncbi:MAG: endonuclease/exonuclease/phosphatase family protein [Bacteroidaceae bacterium]|nr:endonuclease/exonuclease/phosphatase family protein [Bacteroidaceae bacterium]